MDLWIGSCKRGAVCDAYAHACRSPSRWFLSTPSTKRVAAMHASRLSQSSNCTSRAPGIHTCGRGAKRAALRWAADTTTSVSDPHSRRSMS